MKLLLAHSDRDLLQSCATLLAMDGCEVATAFDGTRAAALLEELPFDAAVLGERLPRVPSERLLPLFARERLPAVVLLDRRVSAKSLLRADLPCAYLSFPFLPGELTALVRKVAEMARSGGTIACGPLAVDVSAFRFVGTDVRLTVGEVDLLSALAAGEKVGGRRVWTTILALNEKLRALGGQARIEYAVDSGYRLVSGNA